jgi:hypothetical protein
MTTTINFRAPAETVAQLEAAATATGRDKSEILRLCCSIALPYLLAGGDPGGACVMPVDLCVHVRALAYQAARISQPLAGILGELEQSIRSQVDDTGSLSRPATIRSQTDSAMVSDRLNALGEIVDELRGLMGTQKRP